MQPDQRRAVNALQALTPPVQEILLVPFARQEHTAQLSVLQALEPAHHVLPEPTVLPPPPRVAPVAQLVLTHREQAIMGALVVRQEPTLPVQEILLAHCVRQEHTAQV